MYYLGKGWRNLIRNPKTVVPCASHSLLSHRKHPRFRSPRTPPRPEPLPRPEMNRKGPRSSLTLLGLFRSMRFILKCCSLTTGVPMWLLRRGAHAPADFQPIPTRFCKPQIPQEPQEPQKSYCRKAPQRRIRSRPQKRNSIQGVIRKEGSPLYQSPTHIP